MDKAAVLSECGKYRYTLWRVWDKTKSYALFILLNPSTATATQDDPTVRKCIGFAKRWGYGGIGIVNLFAYRTKSPSVLKLAEAPVGPRNDFWLHDAASEAGIVIAAWGNHGCYLGRDEDVLETLPTVYCLGKTQQPAPKHPLYLPYTTELQKY